MKLPTLRERVSRLEEQVAAIQHPSGTAAPKDWTKIVGMFTGDALMRQIDAASLALREQDRYRAKKSRRKKVAR